MGHLGTTHASSSALQLPADADLQTIEGSDDDSSSQVPEIHVENLDWVPGSWVQPNPLLAIVGIWRVT